MPHQSVDMCGNSAGYCFRCVHSDQFSSPHANYLLAGQWLGPYDTMTISKGMFDPLFLFVVSAVSTPVKIAERLAYLSPADPL